ncbi:MAG: glycosyltransferase family 9 protein [bacterium]|nr:glycosyltransferase family 9 protein [bacterium]
MSYKKLKVLIIKVGYSETLDPEISTVTSYGDVLRTTVLLNLYKEDHVTWLVDEKAYPILKNNSHIDRVLIYNLTSVLQLQSEHFDTVINMEKVPGLCALSDQVTAWRRYGFRFDVKTGEAEAYDGSFNAISIVHDTDKKKNHNKEWQEYLFEMVGAKWDGDEYVFGFQPREEERFDVGFNHKVGNKWPTKAWSMDNWKELESRLAERNISVSWQQGLDNMEDYFQWIHNCRLLVTNDSFGLHLAIAMKKKMVALFGPTNPSETYLYGRGVWLTPDTVECPFQPCTSPVCKHEDTLCISHITPEEVFRQVFALLEK